MYGRFMPNPVSFGDRLDLAIETIAPQHEAALRSDLEKRGETAAGRRGLVALAAGLPTASMLSDIIAGRTPGTRYHDRLAAAVNVDKAWLHGDDSCAPDWHLSPLAAWERWASRIEGHWQRLAGRSAPAQDESVSEIRAAPAQEQRLARLLGLPLGHADLGRLASCRLAACEFQVVVRFAQHLGLPAPSHPEHLQTGQGIARIVDERVESALKTVRRRYSRFMLPPKLFQAARLALAGLKAQRSHQAKEVQTVDDCLEMLWRQQLLRSGQAKKSAPEAFCRETCRGAWTPLNRILARYPEEDDFERHYDTSR